MGRHKSVLNILGGELISEMSRSSWDRSRGSELIFHHFEPKQCFFEGPFFLLLEFPFFFLLVVVGVPITPRGLVGPYWPFMGPYYSQARQSSELRVASGINGLHRASMGCIGHQWVASGINGWRWTSMGCLGHQQAAWGINGVRPC